MWLIPWLALISRYQFSPIGYAIAEQITNVLLKRTGPHIFFTTIVILWGILMTMTGSVQNQSDLLAARWFFAMAESGLHPGGNFYLSCWFNSSETGLRSAMSFSAVAFAGSSGGLLAAAITLMEGVGTSHRRQARQDCGGVRQPTLFPVLTDWKTYVSMVICKRCLCLLMGYSGNKAQLLIGFILLISPSNPNTQYAGTFLGAAAIYPAVSNSLAWVVNNTDGSLRRAVMISLVIGWGSVEGCGLILHLLDAGEAPFLLGATGLSWNTRSSACWAAPSSCTLLSGSRITAARLGKDAEWEAMTQKDKWVSGDK
ncbi:hypothetical protein BJ170DRAFT_704092 [Xylariales sp. AK1849]|nr:hypothetical protein BJ170DRAFT_704092 [Xylariales sp. AK1849]